MKEIPKTKEECFDQLDEMLSEEDKWAIVKSKDTTEFHFTLGLWIRNHWLYKFSEEEKELFFKEFGRDIPFFEPDFISGEIIEEYQKHLRKNLRSKK